MKNYLRFSTQFSSQVENVNKNFSTVIKELKSFADGGQESQTVSFSNKQIEDEIAIQTKVSSKLDSDINLLKKQQEENYEEDKLHRNIKR